MPRAYIAQLIIDPSVRAKILGKHAPLTPEDVEEVLIYGRVTKAGWKEDDEHGLRLVVEASTHAGVEFIAYLMPANEIDPEEGTFVLKSAMPTRKGT